MTNIMLPEIATYQKRIQQFLERCLTIDSIPTRLQEAMRYAVLQGGKRIRPLLVYGMGECFNTPCENLDIPAAAIEMIHCYSLVHDDLPAMDNDDFRRGQPSCHRAFDEATAILVGDALQSLAIELLATKTNYYTATQQLQMIHVLSQAAGAAGMVGGQILDLQSLITSFDIQQLENMHRLKTGKLFSASLQLGALACQCDDKVILNKLTAFGDAFGLAFQLQDDIDDVSVAPNSYLSQQSREETKKRIQELYTNALTELKYLNKNFTLLEKMTATLLPNFILNDQH